MFKHMDQNHHHPIKTPDKTSQRFVLGKEVVCYVCVAVMYFNELQSVCEGMLGAWGVENKP